MIGVHNACTARMTNVRFWIFEPFGKLRAVFQEGLVIGFDYLCVGVDGAFEQFFDFLLELDFKRPPELVG